MAQWAEAERQGAELIASLDEADVSDDRGESIIIDSDEDLDRVFEDIKSLYRARSVNDGPKPR